MLRLSFLLLFISISLTGCSQATSSTAYIQEIRKHRYELNIEFADIKTTPLTKEDFKKFASLDFFPIDSNYRIKANFELNENPKFFEMQTTTDRRPIYKTYGVATFELDGKTHQLEIYQIQEFVTKPGFENYLFIPFKDKTNGNSTYGGGRFLDLEIPDDDFIILDFNKAYNPSCAYNYKYSCPIPPPENHLEIAIKAGVKAFKSVKK